MVRTVRRRRDISVVVLLLAIVFIGLRIWLGPEVPSEPLRIIAGQYEVVRVVDGDTMILRMPESFPAENNPDQNKSKPFRVRLMGVDTPETVHPDPERNKQPFGKEATAFTKNFLSSGTVRLELDRERVDRYGRTLGYLYVGEKMLNEELLRAGLAEARLKYRFSQSKKTLFKRAQQAAIDEKIGIWSLKKAASK